MTLTIKLVSIFAIATLASSASVPSLSKEKAPEFEPLPLDTYLVQAPPQLPLHFQLPREEAPTVPFYPSEPIAYLKAPTLIQNLPPNSYQVPLPAQDLIAPVETVWNPNNDPKFYYEVPASITKEELPTNYYPKKYNKDIHTKTKPISAKPKKEIILEPIDESQYLAKQKELQKVFEKHAKKENQKQIQAEKARQAV